MDLVFHICWVCTWVRVHVRVSMRMRVRIRVRAALACIDSIRFDVLDSVS